MRNSFLIILAAVTGCGSSDPPVQIDAAVPDCDLYCSTIQKNCSGANPQYASTDSCKQTCLSFGPSVNETPGNTLGCRFHYAVDASNTARALDDCTRAGPAGDVLTSSSMDFCSDGDACKSFCALEIKACGSLEMPLQGDPRDASNNSIYQYRNMADCMRLCDDPKLDKTHAYSLSAKGDSLACRLYQATQAAINGVMFCADTAAAPLTGRCTGPATP